MALINLDGTRLRQLGQVCENVAADFLVAEGRFVLAEAETLKPLADIHGPRFTWLGWMIPQFRQAVQHHVRR